MNGRLSIVGTFFLTLSASIAGAGEYPAVCASPDLLNLIREAPTGCEESAELARQCSKGNSRDRLLVDAAMSSCEQELNLLSKSDRELRKKLFVRCDQAYPEKVRQQTHYQSSHAFCLLDAQLFIYRVSVTSVR